MLNQYKKLVAVAEDMATELSKHGEVVSIDVTSGEKYGSIEIQVFCYVGDKYYPDENQYMPAFDRVSEGGNYVWQDDLQEWVSTEQLRLEAEISAYENTMPDLPF